MELINGIPVNIIVSNRGASIALMLAEVHIEDGDCIGDAARELHGALVGKVEALTEFDC